MATKAKRKTSNRKTTGTKAKKSSKRTVNKSNSLPKEVLVIIGLVLAVFLELANFNVLGKVGAALKLVQFGLVGCMAYILPLFILGAFIFAAFAKEKKVLRMILGGVFYLFLCAVGQLAINTDYSQNVLNYFKISSKEFTGGGLFGGLLAAGLFHAVGKAGAIIISILILLIILFLLFRVQIMDSIRSISDTKENLRGSQEQKALREQKKELNRLEKKERYETRAMKLREKQLAREEEVLRTEEDGNVIKIVHVRSRRPNVNMLKRTGRKAVPLRDGTARTASGAKVKGIGNTVVTPVRAAQDDVHEITNARPSIQVTDIKEPSVSDRFNSVSDFSQEFQAAPEVKPSGLSEYGESQDVLDTPVQAPVREKTPRTNISAAAASVFADEKAERREALSGKQLSHGEAQKTFKPVVTGSERGFQLPPISILNPPSGMGAGEGDVNKIAQNLVNVLNTFGVNVELIGTEVGPSVTRFELKPEMGTRVSKVTSLADDLKLNLAVPEIRIEAPIPGKAAIGIEIPNKNRQTVTLRELIQSSEVKSHKSKIAFSAGKDISGNVIVSDLAKMPHMLVAGTTGSGKSVFLNSILMCILYRAKPSEVGLIIIDPKKVEFGVYQGIPHLMKSVVTDPGQAVSTLRWAVGEMTNRYQRMQMSGVRDFKSYNEKYEKHTLSEEEKDPVKMRQIVIVIDELADLMMVAAKEVESLICRLAQLARAAGIHLIIATQRPSVDVVTGLIKANIPARVALLVASGVDSRTIIDMVGAEKLLGNGDMLFYPTGYVKPVRVQGAFVTDKEIYDTVQFLMKQGIDEKIAEENEKIENAISSSETVSPESSDSGSEGEGSGKYDEYLYEAGKLCIESGKASSSMLQRRFSVGFNRAARIIDQLYEIGAIGPQNGSKPREILLDSMGFEERCQELEII